MLKKNHYISWNFFVLLECLFFWAFVAIFSIMFNGMLRMLAKGPSAFSISFRFFVSSVLIAPINGAVIRYDVRKIIVPRIRVIQFAMFRKITIEYVNVAEIIDDIMILIDDLMSMVAL